MSNEWWRSDLQNCDKPLTKDNENMMLYKGDGKTAIRCESCNSNVFHLERRLNSTNFLVSCNGCDEIYTCQRK